jgi:hypothetical protein
MDEQIGVIILSLVYGVVGFLCYWRGYNRGIEHGKILGKLEIIKMDEKLEHD